MERTFLLFLEFDGTDFCGWQRQAVGRSVQSVVEDSLTNLAGQPSSAVAAGRTDAGVHALAMPVSATVPERWTAVELRRALNATLPRDIAVRDVRAVQPGTDARRSATARRYHYRVGIDSAARSPFRSRTEWALRRPLDVNAMHSAASKLRGTHSFRAFAAVGEPRPHYDCDVKVAEWIVEETGTIRFVVEADRFLHHMVRFLVGTMVDIGLQRRSADDIELLLVAETNGETSPPAPAAGLFFVEATYPEECFVEELAA